MLVYTALSSAARTAALLAGPAESTRLPLLLEMASASVTNPAVNRKFSPQPDAFVISHISPAALPSPLSTSHPWLPARLQWIVPLQVPAPGGSSCTLPLISLIRNQQAPLRKENRCLLCCPLKSFQLFCSPGLHLPSSACLGGNFPLSLMHPKYICVCHEFGLTPTQHRIRATGIREVEHQSFGFFLKYTICTALFVLREWLDFRQLLFQRLFVNN